MEREVLSSSWYPVIEHVGMVEICARRGLDLALGSISLQSGWTDMGIGFLVRWLMPPACQTFG